MSAVRDTSHLNHSEGGAICRVLVLALVLKILRPLRPHVLQTYGRSSTLRWDPYEGYDAKTSITRTESEGCCSGHVA